VSEQPPRYPQPPRPAAERLRALLALAPPNLAPPPVDSPPGRILAATRALFAMGGFTAVTVRAVAARAGTNVAMVNYYFGSKERLVDAVLLQEIQLLLHDVVTGIDSEAPPAQVLAEFPLRILASLRKDAERLRLMRLAVSTEPERLRRLIRSLGPAGMLGVSGVLAELVAEAQADGELPPVPARSVLLFLVANAYGLVFMEPIAREVVGFALDDEAQWQEHRGCLAHMLRAGLLGAVGPGEDGHA